jgi:ribosomal protein S18 acetylase RimI-like enzyme
VGAAARRRPPAGDDDAEAGTGQVWGIYALREAWGTGVGRALLTTAVDALRDAGFRSATLWVLDSNARARRFYERAGFAPDGTTQPDTLAGVVITEVRYRRAL